MTRHLTAHPDLQHLTWRGRLENIEGRRVAVIGARSCSQYGEYVAVEIALAIANQDLCTVVLHKGGISAAAARAALTTGGKVIGVVPAAPDVFYPASQADLQSRLLQDGLVVSPSGEARHPSKELFQRASEALIELADAVVVVEAGHRDTALQTARAAHELGIPVYAVPGPVTSHLSEGVHQLLKDGIAQLWTHPDDLKIPR